MADPKTPEPIEDGGRVAMVPPGGGAGVAVPAHLVDQQLKQGWRYQSQDELTEQYQAETYGSQEVQAFAEGMGRTLTGGLYDVVAPALGADVEGIRERRERTSLATPGEIAGAFVPLPGSAVSGAAKLGRVAEAAVGGGKIVRAAVRAGAEGAGFGFGQGVSNVALSDHPMAPEAVIAELGMSTLRGAGYGAAIGGGLSLAGQGLSKVLPKRTAGVVGKADDLAAKEAAVADDIAKLDSKGLKAAKQVEEKALTEAQIPVRRQLAEDLSAYRQVHQTDVKRVASVLKEANEGLVARDLIQSEKALSRFAPRTVERNPGQALEALERNDQMLGIVKQAVSTTSAGAELVPKLDDLLTKNRALQAQISETLKPLSSGRLTAIEARLDELANPSIGAQAIERVKTEAITRAGQVVGGGLGGLIGGYPGMVAGGILGGIVSDATRALVKGGTGQLVAKWNAGVRSAVDGFMKAAPAAGRAASRGATRAAVSYGSSKERERDRDERMKRAKEYSAMVGPDGKITRDQRLSVYNRLNNFRQADMLLADRAETVAVRKAEYLATKAPKVPNHGTPLEPTRYRVPEAQMRDFAIAEAAVDDPRRLVEGLKDGNLSPTTVEAVKAVYPEMFSELVLAVTTRMAERREEMPYSKRIQLSILLGVPMDSTLRPEFIAATQAAFAPAPEEQAGGAAPKVPTITPPEPSAAQRLAA